MSPNEGKTILITGGCGFIGSNFIRYIYHAHPLYNIVNVDLLSYAGNRDNLKDIETLEANISEGKKRYEFIRGDICDAELLNRVFLKHKFDVVVHFAAESHVDRSIFNIVDFVRTNIDGTRVLIEAARSAGIPRFVHISTDEVYGSIDIGFANEETALRPSNPYSASKAGADLLIQAYMKTHNFPAIIVRGSNNYGPYQYPEKLIPLAITNLIEGKKIPVHGDGMHRRSWLHVLDFASAIDCVLHKAPLHSVYNVSGEERTNNEVLALLGSTLTKNIEEQKELINDRPGADMRYAPESSKLQNELGWKRHFSFDQAIAEVVQWYVGNKEWWRAIRLKKGFLDHYERQSKGQWC